VAFRHASDSIKCDTLEDVTAQCQKLGTELGFSVTQKQTNSEAEMLGWIHSARGEVAGIIINAAAWSHTSIAVFDALNIFEGPVIEVHISNVYAREAFRHHSYVSARAQGVIAGCGVQGYSLAVRRLATLLK